MFVMLAVLAASALGRPMGGDGDSDGEGMGRARPGRQGDGEGKGMGKRKGMGKGKGGRRPGHPGRPMCPTGYKLQRSEDGESVICMNKTDRPVRQRAECDVEVEEGEQCPEFACAEEEILRRRFCLICADESTPVVVPGEGEDEKEKLTCTKFGAETASPKCGEGRALEGARCVKVEQQ